MKCKGGAIILVHGKVCWKNTLNIALYKPDKVHVCAKHAATMHGMKLSFKGQSKARAQQAEARQKKHLQKSSPRMKSVGTTRQSGPFRWN